jgi:peptide/nickel transport system ATP-binding protein
MTTAVPVLSVRDLSVQFPTRRGILTAVDRISFDIAAGEVLGVVGESGAGKSMTGAAVMGLLEPPGRISGGEILLKGQRIDNMPYAELRKIRGRRIGMVFQDPLTSLNPLFRIGDQIIETIRTHADVSEAAARERAIQHQFSGGMRQRVVLALALAAEPELIIADEPTTALDVSIQAQIIHLLKRLCRERGAAIMLITHDMGVIAETADRVAVMYAGRIAEIGPVRDVIQRPIHPYTKGLMGSIPTLDMAGGAGGDGRLTQISGAMPRLTAIPQGCAFNPRCTQVMDRCKVAPRPEPVTVGATQAACWLAGGQS